MHHGTVDSTCPPAWARHSARAMERAGVDVTLRWYEREGHTFGPAFDRAMDRTVHSSTVTSRNRPPVAGKP